MASASWIAIKGIDKEIAFERLGLAPIEVKEGYVDCGWTTTADSWVVIAGRDVVCEPERLAQMSASGGSVLSAGASEVVMHSEAVFYEGGVEVWNVSHYSDRSGSQYDLETTGEPPPQFAAIRDAALAAQTAEGGEDADVDMVFDVPLDLSLAICGFRFDQGEFAWNGLVPIGGVGGGPKKRGLLARLFGGR
jgi:hypothetical protein